MPHDQHPYRVIGHPTKEDWVTFHDWAKRERWHVPPQEQRLYQGALADSAFVMRENRQVLGFVTIARHERSGWIGNLLVNPERRREGVGTQLFERAIQILEERGAKTLWLTASREGKHLYNRLGFAEVDKIERWVHVGPYGMTMADISSDNHDLLFRLDTQAWGESRFWLLAHLSQNGRILTAGSTAALLQAGAKRYMVGPWISPSHCPRENRQVLSQIMTAAGRNAEIVIDAIGSSPIKNLFMAAGFGKVGETGLMARGPRTGFQKQHLVALASLGSMG